jgi:hypothetical protein
MCGPRPRRYTLHDVHREIIAIHRCLERGGVVVNCHVMLWVDPDHAARYLRCMLCYLWNGVPENNASELQNEYMGVT